MRATAKFFSLTYVITWSALYFVMRGAHRSEAIMLLGTFAPALVAIGLTYRAEGHAGVAALLKRMLIWDVPARWYVFALAFMPAIKLLVALIIRIGYGAWPRFGTDSWDVIVLATIVSTIPQAGEEIGWRGYALPRLAARLGAGPASIVLGVVWAAWHLPWFFVQGADKSGQSFPVFTLQVTAISVLVAWVYFRTGGSVLLTMLMHSASNQSIGIVPSTVEGATPLGNEQFASCVAHGGVAVVPGRVLPRAHATAGPARAAEPRLKVGRSGLQVSLRNASTGLSLAARRAGR
ncbi:MAG TPA: type II CAAX endopeptidase family protein [Gemmatimonadaceae bacterium]|nr:type II CAAX endopeptidase family protein [Gemmatimonadaceae bacterium]